MYRIYIYRYIFIHFRSLQSVRNNGRGSGIRIWILSVHIEGDVSIEGSVKPNLDPKLKQDYKTYVEFIRVLQ